VNVFDRRVSFYVRRAGFVAGRAGSFVGAVHEIAGRDHFFDGPLDPFARLVISLGRAAKVFGGAIHISVVAAIFLLLTPLFSVVATCFFFGAGCSSAPASITPRGAWTSVSPTCGTSGDAAPASGSASV
jgi:hypothetical protein